MGLQKDPIEDMLRHERDLIVRARVPVALRQLSERDQKLIHLALLKERSIDEIAREFGLAEDSTRRALSYARARLRRQLLADPAFASAIAA